MQFALLIVLALICQLSQAQQINGLAKDEEGMPLKGATANLIRASDSNTIKLAIVEENGNYFFSGMPQGRYQVMISHLGYWPSFSPVFIFDHADLTIPELKLRKKTDELANLTVTTKRSMIELKTDRIVFNVAETINATGSNAMELLRKSPGVLVGKNDNISLSGKNGVQIYLEGKPTPLSGEELATYLKSLPSFQIDAIEIITNPSAKYEAAGNAGIINIRLVKNKGLGTNGSVNAGWNIGKTPKYNAGSSLNHRNKKWNVFSTYSISEGTDQQYVTFERSINDSLFKQSGIIKDSRRSHNIKWGIDYFLNKKNTLGGLVNAIFSDPRSVTSNKTAIYHTYSSLPDRLLVASNDNLMKRHSNYINLNYNYADGNGRTFLFNADRATFDFNSNQMQSNHYFTAVGQNNLGTTTTHLVSPSQINLKSFKSDYEQNLAKGKLGIGAKTAWVKTDNTFEWYNVYQQLEKLNQDKSNHFVYRELITSGYLNYNRQLKKFMIQVGLRAEHTKTQTFSERSKSDTNNYAFSSSSLKRAYTDLFPAAVLTLNNNPMKQWSLSYSRRIDRPSYQDLNPFEFKLDEYTFIKGNVNLRPQYTSSLGLLHTYMHKLNISLNYSHVSDMLTELFDTVDKSKAFVSKTNLANQHLISFNLSYPFHYKSYSLFANISSNYSKYTADFGTGRKIDAGAFGLNIFTQNSMKLSPTCTAELSGFYNAPTIYNGNSRGRSVYNIDLGLSRTIMKGSMTIKGIVSDLFGTQRFNFISDFAGQEMKVNFLPESRLFKLNINYRFGNTTLKITRQNTPGAEEELKRVQHPGGMVGNN